MSTYPNHNVIDRIYRHCSKTMRSNIILNINNTIFKTALINSCSDKFHFIVCNQNPKEELDNIYDLFNIDIYATADYIQHSQHRNICQQYHIKELLLFNDPPNPLLKREDLILLSDRLEDTNKIIIGSDNINSSWSFLSDSNHIPPGIPVHELNTETRNDICILHDGSGSAQKLLHVLIQQFPKSKIISKFDDYNDIMQTLNTHKVCINLNSCIDSLYALYAGCSVISSIRAYNHEQVYENIEHMIELISKTLLSFDIKQKIDIHNSLEKQYNNEIFTDNISNLISKYTREPFYI